jgi:hypothetical protein
MNYQAGTEDRVVRKRQKINEEQEFLVDIIKSLKFQKNLNKLNV